MAELIFERGGGRAAGAVARLLTDDGLVERAAEGSEAAFAEIFRRHHQALFRYAVSILGNEDDARDVVQQTMVSLLRSLPGEERKIELRPWLFRIAHNEAISLRRRRTEAPLEGVPEPPARAQDSATRIRVKLLIEDLAGLPDRQRSALVMRELNGLTHAEIAAALGVSAAAAKQAVYEARCALQEQEEGREMSCDDARRAVSSDDRRRLRGRKLRAHLRACAGCRSFAGSISSRRSDFTAIGFLPAGAAAELLAGLLGSGGGGAGGGGGAAVGGAVGALKAGGGVGGAKLLAGATAAVVSVTAISVEGVRTLMERGDTDSTPTEAIAAPPASAAAGAGAAREGAKVRGAASPDRAVRDSRPGNGSKADGDAKGNSGAPGDRGSPHGPAEGGGPPPWAPAGGPPDGRPGNGPPAAAGPPADPGRPASPPGQDVAAGNKPIVPGLPSVPGVGGDTAPAKPPKPPVPPVKIPPG